MDPKSDISAKTGEADENLEGDSLAWEQVIEQTGEERHRNRIEEIGFERESECLRTYGRFAGD